MFLYALGFLVLITLSIAAVSVTFMLPLSDTVHQFCCTVSLVTLTVAVLVLAALISGMPAA